jgi:predicted helicase
VQNDYDVLIPAWYLEQYKALGTRYGHLPFTECKDKCYRHGKKLTEWDIMYEEKIMWRNNAINIGSVAFNPITQLAEKLPP